ncbi:hypothetical protein [Streptomyces sp. NPDC092307]|uniref:hypothetical protein n=1 Tax=Streptomyces sp. NPDC092307 TaxID=3366013 RepID=UPI0038215EC7
MTKIVPRHVVVDGVQLLALTAQEYESLAASRRQFGSHVVRLRMTREALASLTRAAEAMCSLIRTGKVATVAATADPPTVENLLSGLEAAIEQAHRAIGRQADAPPGSADGRRQSR